MIRKETIEFDLIRDKVHDFYILETKVHLTKRPSNRYPYGKFLNGNIMEIFSNKFRFNDDKEGIINIYFFEVADVEAYKQEVNSDGTA